ncbi:MAG: hypothetical protein JF597_36965 [Streptomyces sp.]|uniref:hypothetical protein n=1 Tax=Streptomyces sp. TaxID=1931 RepID=UPI0025F01BC8|nr:hypothetical protein [Streptomyces sp.]MBW8798964.1 hypothetical protein [Streptomyces sp.]
MSERLTGGGAPGRRRAQTGDALSGHADAHAADLLETVLGTAIRADDPAPDAEQRAVAAFRAAHSAGAHRARTRRRDDWRPVEKRRARRPVKLTFGVVFAGLALGGVAVAAVGSVGSSTEGTGPGTGRGTAHPSSAAPDRPGDAGPSPSSGSVRPTDRPATAQDTEAHCRAYEQVQGHGKALDSTAWQRLVAAAGGEDRVAAYCSGQLTGATAAPSGSTGSGKSAKGAANSANGSQGDTGSSARSTPGNSQANGGQGNGKDK